MHTVGADQQVGAGAAAVGEVRGDTILLFVDANQLLGVVDSTPARSARSRRMRCSAPRSMS